VCCCEQLCRRLLYAARKEAFDTTLTTIKENFSSFYAYLTSNWLPYETLFARYARAGVMHLDNHTNNRLERYHHTIKSVLGSSQVSVGILVERLHKLLCVRAQSWKESAFAKKFTTRKRKHSVVNSYSSLASDYAVSVIEAEYEKSLSLTHPVQQVGDALFCLGKHQTTADTCTCSAFTSYALPCRHIFCVRRHCMVTETDVNLVAARWRITDNHIHSAGNEPAATGCQSVHVTAADVNVADATVSQRFRTLMAVLTPLASTLAELPRQQFAQCLRFVNDVEHVVRDGSWSHVHFSIDDHDVEPTYSRPATLALTVETVDAAESPTGMVHTAEQPTNTSDPEPRTLGTSTQQTDTALATPAPTFSIPRKVKQRGSSAAARQRRFQVKKVTSIDEHTVQAPQPAAVTKRGGTCRRKRTSLDNAATEASVSDNCAECGHFNPPKRLRGNGRIVDWVQCDKCDYWYHSCCIGTTLSDTNADFVCVRCE